MPTDDGQNKRTKEWATLQDIKSEGLSLVAMSLLEVFDINPNTFFQFFAFLLDN